MASVYSGVCELCDVSHVMVMPSLIWLRQATSSPR